EGAVSGGVLPALLLGDDPPIATLASQPHLLHLAANDRATTPICAAEARRDLHDRDIALDLDVEIGTRVAVALLMHHLLDPGRGIAGPPALDEGHRTHQVGSVQSRAERPHRRLRRRQVRPSIRWPLCHPSTPRADLRRGIRIPGPRWKMSDGARDLSD